MIEQVRPFSLSCGDAQMKRIVPCALGAFVVASLLGVFGCDSGGVETGVPANADKAQGVPADQLPKLAPIIPPGVKKKDDVKLPDTASKTPEAGKVSAPK
jgi:hypothetical protein